MKIECVKERFEKALVTIEKIAVKNATLPILSCVLLETRGNTLLLRTTNLELGVELSLPVKVIEDGIVAIPIANLLSFVSAIPNEKGIFITATATTVEVKAGRSVASFTTMNHADFPVVPMLIKEGVVTFPVVDIVNAIKSVLFSSAINTVKPEYASIFLFSHEDQLVCVATDSFRLAEKKIVLKKGKEIQPILIPNKNANEIVKILALLQEKEVEIRIDGQQISFTTPTTYITSRLIGGNFPDYKQIIPKTTETEVVVAKQDFINAMKVASVFQDAFLQVYFHIIPKSKTFEIKTKNQIIGEQTTTLPAAFEGDEVVMGFNHRYVMDCMASIPSDTISFSFSGQNKPVILRGVSDKTFLYLVMPMNR